MKASFFRVFRGLVLATAGLCLARCEEFDAAPQGFLPAATDGLLPDATVPVVLKFTKPVKVDTVHTKIVRYALDPYGKLPDEDGDPNTTLDVFFDSDSKDTSIGQAVVAPTRDAQTITLVKPLPPGPRLAVLVEAGLEDDKGATKAHRQRIPFGYEGVCSSHTKSAVFHDGVYFMLIAVTKPLPVIVELFADFALNDDGTFSAHFTDAARSKVQTCPTTCKSSEVCRLLPSPECVAPSDKAGAANEYPDFVPFPDPPFGFNFPVTGCVGDQDDAAVLQADPVDIIVQSPPVTLSGAKFTGQFVVQADGTLSASGSLTAPDVLLADQSAGSGEGSFTAVEIPTAKVPAGVPGPPLGKT